MLKKKRDKNGDSVQLHAQRDAIVARIISVLRSIRS